MSKMPRIAKIKTIRTIKHKPLRKSNPPKPRAPTSKGTNMALHPNP